MKRRQRGMALIATFFLIGFLSFLVIKGMEIKQFNVERNKGQRLSKDVVIIIQAWTDLMDHKCMTEDIGSMSPIETNDLPLASTLAQRTLPLLAINYSLPPQATIQLQVKNITATSEAHFIHALRAATPQLTTQLTIIEHPLSITATRLLTSSATANYSRLSTSEAADNTIMSNGMVSFGNGC